MISYELKEYNSANNIKINGVIVSMPLSDTVDIEFELISFGAGIRSITMKDMTYNRRTLLTLSYKDVFESCHNDSLAGLTIGPNAGRVEAGKDITISDEDEVFSVQLEPNEGEGINLHGGADNIAKVNWILKSVELNEDKSCCKIHFSTAQEDGINGWPGYRIYDIIYTLSIGGSLDISYIVNTNLPTYINMTNHTYWLRRNGMKTSVNADSYIKNRDDFLPEEIISIDKTNIPYFVTDESILNNGFLLCDTDKPAAIINYADLPLSISLFTDTPVIVVYTGDYLDATSTLLDGTNSSAACGVALEPQEMYPLTSVTITTPEKPFSRHIKYLFALQLST